MCEYCDDVPSRYKSIRAEGSYQTAADDIYDPEIDVNFCPNCGRPLTEPKPLTLDELKQRNTPVWVPVGDDMGYWCLCNDGMIMPPSGRVFIAKDRPNWTFYDHEPHEVK